MKSWKTTIIGIIILGLTWHNIEKLDNTPFYVMIALGVSLLFAPDTLISGLKRLLTRKSKEV